jgi:hypothetical protein
MAYDDYERDNVPGELPTAIKILVSGAPASARRMGAGRCAILIR